jgi:hypothetical protein
MFNAIERLSRITHAAEPETRGKRCTRSHDVGASLFAMAAWKRMLIALSAISCLWLTILWATRL